MIFKTTKTAFVFLAITGSWQAAQAQAPMSSYDYYLGRQIIVGSASAGEAASSRASGRAATTRESRGSAKIKAGKATTSFVPSLEGTKLAVANLAFDPGEPQDLAGQIRYVRNYVSQFNRLLTESGFTVNDFPDGYVFAYAMAYEVHNNKKLDLKDLQRMREEKRELALNSPNFQGVESIQKQARYELNACVVMQALEWREKARQAQTSRERRVAEERARSFVINLIEGK